MVPCCGCQKSITLDIPSPSKNSQANVEAQADATDRRDRPPQERKWRQLQVRIPSPERQYEASNSTLTEYWKTALHCIADSLIMYIGMNK